MATDGNPVLQEHSPLDMPTAVHIANGNPAHYGLLQYIPGTFRTNGFALFRATNLVSCFTLTMSEVPVFSPNRQTVMQPIKLKAGG